MKKPVRFEDVGVIDADAVVFVEDIGTNICALYCSGWDDPVKVHGELEEVLAKLGIVILAEKLESPVVSA